MPNFEFEVVTIVKNRSIQLRNQIHSICDSTILPCCHHIIFMNSFEVIDTPFLYNVKTYRVDDNNPLPLAKARNKGLEVSSTNFIIFLDVDCIVSPTLFENMLKAKSCKNVITAYPKYLKQLPSNGDYKSLRHSAIDHPKREKIASNKKVEWRKFWSLVFLVDQEQMQKVGGFDENFKGYGGEDTDLAMEFNQKNYELLFVDDNVLHQYHDKFSPPLQHIRSIVENANYYYSKWRHWPMQKWLSAFEEKELIFQHNSSYSVISFPTSKDIEKARSRSPY